MVVVANLIAYKGHSDLLEALAKANSRLPSGWRLFVAGRDDGAGATLKSWAEALGIGDNTIWAGERSDPDNVYAAADLFVLPSHEEGFSNSLIEAMGYGLPVIATAVGGNLDAVQSGDSGVLVPVRTPEALGEAIVGTGTRPATEGPARQSCHSPGSSACFRSTAASSATPISTVGCIVSAWCRCTTLLKRGPTSPRADGMTDRKNH